MCETSCLVLSCLALPGCDAVVWVRAQAGRLCIRVASGDAPRANTHVDVFVDVSAIAIFDTQDGHRL